MHNIRENRKADRVFLIYLSVLVVLGLAALFSASTPVGYAKFHDAYYFVKRQILFGIFPGIVAIIFFNKINLNTVKKLSWPIYLLSLGLLCMVLVPGVGLTLNNSSSWLNVGGFTFQPSEFSKLAIIIILAYFLSHKKQNWDDWQTSILPIFAVIGPSMVLILKQDLGTATIIVLSVMSMLFLAKVPMKYLGVLAALGVACFVILIIIAPYRVHRITTLLHPELDPQGVGYQMNQAFLAVGSGGFWGLGFGNSRQKYQYLPEVSADTIFAIIAEENGFVVSVLFIFLILVLIWRGFKIAKGTQDQFGALLVSGIMVWFGWQSLLNIGATVGALPLTGVPLPFVSHGGSALVMALAAAGLVLNVSKESVIN